MRQQFTGYERDNETGLDFAQARYFSSTQGRFLSPDAVAGSQLNPQTLNLYAYVQNNPLRFTDPTGRYAQKAGGENATFVSSGRWANPDDRGSCYGGRALRCGQQQDPARPTTVKPPAPEGYVWTKAGELAKTGEETILRESVDVAANAGKRGIFKRFFGRVASFFGGLAVGIIADEMANPSQTAGGGNADLGPANLPWLTPEIQATFMGDSYNPQRLARDTVYYRYFDDGYMINDKGVGYLSEDLYSTSAEARDRLALVPPATRNTASRVAAVVVPSGTVVARGQAKGVGTANGGGSQVVIGNPRDSNIRWGQPKPLP